MGYKKFKVNEECIGCRACVEIAKDNFSINDANKAFLKKQPESEEEQNLCNEALNICPVKAISILKDNEIKNRNPILATSNVKEVLEKYPELIDVLLSLSPKFKRLTNPLMFNTLAKYASFKDASKVTGVSICEILHSLNKYLGLEEQLTNSMPECITKIEEENRFEFDEIKWEEPKERYIYNENTINEITEMISNLKPDNSLLIVSKEIPNELIKVSKGLGYKVNLRREKNYVLSVFNPNKGDELDWRLIKDDFETLDVRRMTTDPFDVIIKKAYSIEEGNGFVLIQRFEPLPLINMLTEMGFDYYIEKKGIFEVWVYFYKKPGEKDIQETIKGDKPDVVIQSATPVAYPVIMRLLQSKRFRDSVNIKELKIWEETEKHLGWIVNGKADISFSALITSVKLKSIDVKIPALFVWDNFVLLTRGYKADGFEDLRGKTIYTPLFKEAPPAKITKYLIKAKGLNPDDFIFAFGEPFGRPEKILEDFVRGNVDTVILREPEASFAIKIMKDRGEEISIISFNKIWNEVNKGFGSFPNAGIVFKGEFVRKFSEVANIILEELKIAIQQVNENKDESANLSYDMMRQPVDRVRLFLDRVNFKYVSGEELVKKVSQYFDVLIKEGIVETELNDEFLSVFNL